MIIFHSLELVNEVKKQETLNNKKGKEVVMENTNNQKKEISNSTPERH